MVVDVVALTLTRMSKSVVTGQAPVTLEWKNTGGGGNENGTYIRAGSSESRNVSASDFCALIENELKNEIWQGCSSRPYKNTVMFGLF